MQLFHEKNPNSEDVLTAISIVEGILLSTPTDDVLQAKIDTEDKDGETMLTITIESSDSEETLRRSFEQINVYINGLKEAMEDAVATRKELEELIK
jgi:hypothetical protein